MLPGCRAFSRALILRSAKYTPKIVPEATDNRRGRDRGRKLYAAAIQKVEQTSMPPEKTFITCCMPSTERPLPKEPLQISVETKCFLLESHVHSKKTK